LDGDGELLVVGERGLDQRDEVWVVEERVPIDGGRARSRGFTASGEGRGRLGVCLSRGPARDGGDARDGVERGEREKRETGEAGAKPRLH
jgi:hypothetical protein